MRRLALLWLALALGCATPTELVVVVDSNLRIPDEIDSVVVEVTGPGGAPRSVTQSLVDPSSPAFPLTLGVTPESGSLGPVRVRAAGRLAGVEVVSQEAEVTLVEGASRVLRLYLLRSCVGRSCPETCGLSGCEPSSRADLDPWDEVIEPLPDDPCLASPWDVDGDGDGDAACGGGDCADGDATRSSLIEEGCNDLDDDCDGNVDEGCPCMPIGATRPCQTDCRTEGTEECVDGFWAACVPPTEVCNGIDDDCDGLTDQGYDWETTMRRTVGSEESRDPRMIWAGDRFVVAWHRNRDGSGIYAMTMAADGTEITPATHLTEEVDAFEMAWSGRVLAFAWWDREGCGTDCVADRIRFQLFDLDTLGQLIDVQGVEGNANANPRVRIAWNGAAFGISFSDGGETDFQRYDESGMQVGMRFDSAPDGDYADMLWDGARYVLAYEAGDQLSFRVGNAMGFADPIALLPVRVRRPEIVQTGAGFLAAFVVDDAARPLSVISTDPDGQVTGGPTELAPSVGFNGASRNAEAGLVAAGQHGIVTWVDEEATPGQAYFARVGLGAEPLQGATTLTPAPTNAVRTTAATDGTIVWVAWSEERDPRLIQLARLACAP